MIDNAWTLSSGTEIDGNPHSSFSDSAFRYHPPVDDDHSCSLIVSENIMALSKDPEKPLAFNSEAPVLAARRLSRGNGTSLFYGIVRPGEWWSLKRFVFTSPVVSVIGFGPCGSMNQSNAANI